MSIPFWGGIHPHDEKSATAGVSSRPLAPPSQVVIPMSLHIGAPCAPTVKVGDTVKMGQKIGDSEAPVSAPIHASVSGKVVAVEPRLHPNGSKVMSVVIENDGLDALDANIVPHKEFLDNPGELIRIIREAGIVGMGGATFPTAFKITSSLNKVDTVIINAAECEPFITSDHRTMLEHSDEVIEGIRILRKIFGRPLAYVGIEKNKPDAISLLSEKSGNDIKIVPLRTRYPQGAEKQLIQSITGREVPPGGLPADVKCVVFNLFTAYSVYRAVYEGMPAIERVVTVAGDCVAAPGNFICRIGTPIENVFNAAGGFKTQPSKILMGGPMMGNAQFDLSAPVIKGTNALLAFSGKEDKTVENPTCIRCGKCAEVCPMRLVPMYMHMYERKNDLEYLEKLHVTDCIECGACTYICPGRLHLTQSFRTGKAKLNAEKARKQAAEKAAKEAENK